MAKDQGRTPPRPTVADHNDANRPERRPRASPSRAVEDRSHRPRRLWAMVVPLVLIALGLGYTGYWHHASDLVRRNVAHWVAVRNAAGWQASYADITVHGFPFAINVTVQNPVVQAPAAEGGWNWRSASVTARLNPLSLGQGSVDVSGTHALRLPETWGGAPATATVGTAVVEFAQDLSGQPLRRAMRIANARVDGLGAPLTIGALDGEVVWLEGRDGDRRAPTLTATVTGRAIDLPPGLDLPIGTRIQSLETRAAVLGTIPPGDLAFGLAKWREAGGTVEVGRLFLDWPPLRLNGAGTLAVDEQLQPIGSLTATIEGFFEAVDSLAAKGIVRSRDASMVKVVLGMMARTPAGGGPPSISLPLTIQNRMLNAGPVSLIRIPDIRWSDSHSPGLPMGPVRMLKPRPDQPANTDDDPEP